MNVYKVGLDIGSTTTKMVVLDKDGTIAGKSLRREGLRIQKASGKNTRMFTRISLSNKGTVG